MQLPQQTLYVKEGSFYVIKFLNIWELVIILKENSFKLFKNTVLRALNAGHQP